MIDEQNTRSSVEQVSSALKRGMAGGTRPVPDAAMMGIESAIESVGGAWQESVEYAGAVGRTTFDLPTSQDNLITLVLAKEHVAMGTLGSQSIVRIKSGVPTQHLDAGGPGSGEGPPVRRRDYLGVVVAGPFAEPDGLRGDTPVI